ncbi:MAG: rhodanese-like domain-containing protein [Flavobacteriia bacterium]|nr:rhodanese-like domain-containing protein [Flavobacteriia bacterium]OIP47075.1 MAG: rhodanese [Flavobacteriaceae bacterium CG2_30_31_66]PIV97806.1 MAG: rhodanese-like domain-containing protein [Flavobacteriaceae bacterium CG17_big_fil_post_rev_8_21_14_2_50_31_13]PIX15382.1 MAG: rhodanese-like domain-containing protein [Flavobacteriaceae bacterium CG_4_8_14_3_um_filter_31_8]PIY14543.1 MAG: rhodanese-like domain-containing protein [Flavobacteriaceae bacterium CG_4_10_14_3_um_filter_31_253]PIZ1
MKYNLLLFLFISSVPFLGQEKLNKLLNTWNTRNVPYISAEGLKMTKEKTIILDAREESEYQVSHLKNAIFVGYNSFNLKGTLAKLPKDKSEKIVVYCSLGIRSETIAHKLIQNGFTNVYNLYGGIFEWKNKDFQIVDTLENPTEKVHTFNKNWGKWLHKGIKVYD